MSKISEILRYLLYAGVFFTACAQVSLLVRLRGIRHLAGKPEKGGKAAHEQPENEGAQACLRKDTQAMMESYYNGISSIISYKGPDKKQDG